MRQHDFLLPGLTVRETLECAAALRSVADDERDACVGDVLRELNLTEVSHLPIGSLSGGQRRKVVIGCQLVSEPCVLLLDEVMCFFNCYSFKCNSLICAVLRVSPLSRRQVWMPHKHCKSLPT